MTKKRRHESNAKSYMDRDTSIEKTVKNLGHQFTTGDWRESLTSSNKKPSKFLGRTVIGSELVVDKLQKSFPNVRFATTAGHLSLDLMLRGVLDGNSRADYILSDVQEIVARRYPEEVECFVGPHQLKEIKNGIWATQVPLHRIDQSFNAEFQLTRDLLRKSRLEANYLPQSVRLAESFDREEANEIGREAFQLLGRSAILTPPMILTTD